jgi:hypothetical protein
LFELAYLPPLPELVQAGPHGRAGRVGSGQESLFGTRRLRADLPRGGSGRDVRIQLN